MNYQGLFATQLARPIRVGLVGVGDFGATLLDQIQKIPKIEITVICDKYQRRMDDAVRNSGLTVPPLMVNDITAETVPDFDVLVEATGQPEPAAALAEWAIEKGRHVVMASKEAGIVVGPILHRRAKARGVVYTEVEGDQPSLLIGLISWAETLGLAVLAAGKSSEYDFVIDNDDTMTWLEKSVPHAGMLAHWETNGEDWADVVARRGAVVTAAGFPTRTVADFCELGVVANATGLMPDSPALHAPLLRPVELADAFQTRADGGLLSKTKIIDVFNCLRRHDEMSFAGGVFIIVRCDNPKTWDLLRGKGHVVAMNTKTAMLFIGQHTLGVEAPMSILSAALLGLPTGAINPRPIVDLVARTTRPFSKGDRLTITDPHHHAVAGLSPELVTSRPEADAAPIPYYLATGRVLLQDVPAGAMITWGMIDLEPTSTLYRLRQAQDKTWNDSWLSESSASSG
jgi:predicted homoserine dehydrogenase-like protein